MGGTITSRSGKPRPGKNDDVTIDRKRNSMKTRAALLTAASLSLAALVPSGALAATNDGEGRRQGQDEDRSGGHRRRTRGFLGVGVADVDEDRAKELGLHEDYGSR
jgi:hypothetical protein